MRSLQDQISERGWKVDEKGGYLSTRGSGGVEEIAQRSSWGLRHGLCPAGCTQRDGEAIVNFIGRRDEWQDIRVNSGEVPSG